MTESNKPNIESLTYRINNWNDSQAIKKQSLGLLPNIWASQNVGMYRQRYYALQSNETGLDQISREQVVRLSRELFFQLPVIGVASDLKSKLVVGNAWDFKYNGPNKDEYENFINNNWYNNCSTKGFAFDFKSLLRIMSRTIDMDGDVLELKVRNKKNNWPLLQYIGSHRVGSIGSSNIIANPGTNVVYNGKEYKCLDGIVYNENDEIIGYSIKKDDAQICTVPPDPKVPNNGFVVPAENAQLIFDPLVFDKARGLPALYSSVLYGLQIEDLDNFLMDIAKLEATIAYIIKNDAGQAPQEYENLLNEIQQASSNNNNLNLPAITPTVHGVSTVKGPTQQYIKADGGDLKSFHSDRPSEQIQNYIRTIETKLLAAIGIPHQLIYSPEQISGRTVNTIQQIVKQNVSDRQRLIKKFAKSTIAWVLSVSMEEGFITKDYKTDLVSNIDFTMPPDFCIDDDNKNRQNLELYKVGLLSGDEFCKSNDNSYSEISDKRKSETMNLLNDAQDIKSKHKDVDLQIILNLLTQRGTSTLQIKEQELDQENNQDLIKK